MNNRIVELKVENVKRIEVADIGAELLGDPLIKVGGGNGQGKSSLLDAIMYALGGEGLVCEEPLRRGAKKGAVWMPWVEAFADTAWCYTFTHNGLEPALMGYDSTFLLKINVFSMFIKMNRK